MLKDERLNLIEKYILEKKYVSTEDLMYLTNTSKATLRRDLIELESEQRIKVVRGGASINRPLRAESSYAVKESICAEEKHRIGEAAAKLVSTGDSIFIASGTTCRAMIPYLKEVSGLMVATNDILIASDLNDCDNIDTHVIGGQLRKGYYTLRGHVTEEELKSIRFSKGFFSCDSIDVIKGCYLSNIDEIGMLKQAISSVSEFYILVDHTKFSQDSPFELCKINNVHTVITDSELGEREVKALQSKKVKVIIA